MQQPKIECSCPKCAELCRYNPGWMTPEEAKLAIAAGFGGRLMRDWLGPCQELGNTEKIWILCPATEGYEGKDALEFDFFRHFLSAKPFEKGVCNFLKDGLCEIHQTEFKPLQCRMAKACDEERNEECPDNFAMAKLWDNPEAQELVRSWQQQQASTTPSNNE